MCDPVLCVTVTKTEGHLHDWGPTPTQSQHHLPKGSRHAHFERRPHLYGFGVNQSSVGVKHLLFLWGMGWVGDSIVCSVPLLNPLILLCHFTTKGMWGGSNTDVYRRGPR